MKTSKTTYPTAENMRGPIFALFAAILLMLESPVVGTATPVNINLCFIVWDDPQSHVMMLHANHAIQYHTNRIGAPHLSFKLVPLLKNTNDVVLDVVSVVLEPPEACHAYLGPFRSSRSTLLNPLIDRPWLSATASSTSLSDKFLFPLFTRTIPSDAIGGAAMSVLLQRLGYTKANVLCVEEPYSQSVVQGFTADFTEAGNTLGVTACFPDEGGAEEEIEAAVAAIMASNTLVTVLPIVPGTDAYTTFVRIAKRYGLNTNHVIVMSEAVCSPTQAALRDWRGAMCVSYAKQAAPVADYTASWAKADNKSSPYSTLFSPSVAAYLLGQTDQSLLTSEPTVYDALMIDGVQLMMTAFRDASALNSSLDLTAGEATDFIRTRMINTSFDGISGRVELNQAGDRNGSLVELFNIGEATTLNTIGVWTLGQPVESVVLARENLFWKGSYSSADSPAQSRPLPEESNVEVTIIVGVFVAVVVILVTMGSLYRFKQKNPELVRQMLGTGIMGVVGVVLLNIAEALFSAFSIRKAIHEGNGSAEFRIVYAAFGILALPVFISSLAAFIAGFTANLTRDRVDDDVTAMELRERTKAASHAGNREAVCATISIPLQHAPMLVLAVLAFVNSETSEPVYMISVVLSSVLIGWKLQYLTAIYASIWQPQSHSSAVLHSLGISREDVTSLVDPSILQRIRLAYCVDASDRVEAVESVAKGCMEYLNLEDVEPSEFFAAILPHLVYSFDQLAAMGAGSSSGQQMLSILSSARPGFTSASTNSNVVLPRTTATVPPPGASSSERSSGGLASSGSKKNPLHTVGVDEWDEQSDKSSTSSALPSSGRSPETRELPVTSGNINDGVEVLDVSPQSSPSPQ